MVGRVAVARLVEERAQEPRAGAPLGTAGQQAVDHRVDLAGLGDGDGPEDLGVLVRIVGEGPGLVEVASVVDEQPCLDVEPCSLERPGTAAGAR